jgi:spermidine synthase
MDQKQQDFKIETEYNSLHAVYRQGKLELRGKDRSLQSVINLKTPHRLELRNLDHLMSVLLFMPSPGRILMLGTAAGSLLHFLRYHYPQAQITALDIDKKLVDRLLQLDILPAADERLCYLHADAADYIKHCRQDYDLLLVDVFDGARSPAWLLTNSSIRQLRSLVCEQGALAFNLLVDSDHDFRQFYRDFRQQFQQQTISLPVAGLENRIVYGIRGKSVARDMNTNLQTALDMSARLGIDFMPILSLIYNTNPAGVGLI